MDKSPFFEGKPFTGICVGYHKNGIRTEWDVDGKKTFQGNFVDGNEE